MSTPELAGTSPERFIEIASTIEPRMSESSDVGDFEDAAWQGKYAAIAHRYYNGLVEDLVEAGMPMRNFKGGILGYRVYGAILAQVPYALMKFAPDAPKDNLALYDALTQSLVDVITPVAGVPSDTNKRREAALHLKHLPIINGQVGYEFYQQASRMRYRPCPEIVETVPVEVSERSLTATGLSYEASKAKRCVLPLEVHAKIWGAMVHTCVFNYHMINADLDALRAGRTPSEVQ